MLAAASCTSATTPTPNPEPKPDPMPNPPSGGMNGGDTNPGGGQNMMNAASQELEAARMGLTTVFDSKAKNLGLYVGYKKTQQNLTKAYDAAKNVLDNSSSTTQNLNEAKTRLETAIRTAATSKQTFDEQHAELVKVYKELKTTLSNETATLAPYADSQYAGIKMHLSGLYDAGKAITTKTLEPVEGDPLTASAVMMANTKIVEAIKDEVLNPQKENATKLADSFVKQVINKTKITGTTKTENQPGNYSFVGFSNDLDHKIAGNAGNPPSNLPTWNFAQRKVWTSETKTKNGSTDIVESPTSKTDVSWIYSLSGETTKYTLEFIYYGPSTVYLYFPYKLVKSADSSLVALQYKLNGGEQQPITFAADNQQNVEATANKTPTVSDINVAKVSLSGLKFGSNTIELSVPTENPAKVALMIGNIYIYIYIYITSNDQNTNKVYDDIFGNKQNIIDNKKSVTVDLLTGYSLASSWSTYIGQFTKLTDQKTMYLVGFIGGPNERVANNTKTNKVLFPYTWGNARTITIYVNAPVEGQYYISGSYITSKQRGLQFTAGDAVSQNTNVVKVNVTGKSNWTSVGTFDTSKTSGNDGTVQGNTRTLLLKEGLNKIIIAGDTLDSKSAPYIGNLTFTLKTSTTSNDETGAIANSASS